jgi:TonB family protein
MKKNLLIIFFSLFVNMVFARSNHVFLLDSLSPSELEAELRVQKAYDEFQKSKQITSEKEVIYITELKRQDEIKRSAQIESKSRKKYSTGSRRGSENNSGHSIGEGLGSRTYKGSAAMSKNYNTSGTVVVKVSVDEDGKVTSAVVVTNQGTNTSDPTLHNLAVQNAFTYRFAPGDATTGTITYTFKVK